MALKSSRVPENAQARIRAVDAEREIAITSDMDRMVELLPRIEIAAGDFPPGLISRAPQLRWDQVWYAGTDWLQKHPEVQALPFTLTNASGIHGGQMAEHLFALLLSWCRKLPEAFAAQPRHEWLTWTHHDMFTLGGKTMLIVGYGAIGERFAQAAEGFGMRVVGVRKHPDRPAGTTGRRVEGIDKLPELLGLADVVVNVLPYTMETVKLFGAKEFNLMKRSAVFANMGRGITVDETALIEALAAKRIAGAVSDVAAAEPLPHDSPLWDADNFLLTSHYSGFHPKYDDMAFDVFIDNLGRYVRGEPLRNIVDKAAGY